MKLSKVALLSFLAVGSTQTYAVSSVAEAIADSDVKVNARLRYEHVDQEGFSKDANALTLRTRLTLQTASYYGLTALLEFEDSRDVFGVDQYNDTLGRNAGVRPVIADPNTTELDQALLKYQRGIATAAIGRQAVELDNLRFIGGVGWRQDRQVFDTVQLSYTLAPGFDFNYYFFDERNRIFADERDIDSEDHIVNIGYKTDIGKLTGYAYLLENEQIDGDGLDTYGVRFAGATKLGATPFNYQLEYATQENDLTNSDADYYLIELGSAISGIGVKAGYEVLGSDDGSFGFATPLATLHKFNGWADVFLNTPAAGLVDFYINVSTKLFGGKAALIYHDFSADESSPGDDFGTEIDALYVKPLSKNYTLGFKYANYNADDFAVDIEKFWVWAEAKF